MNLSAAMLAASGGMQNVYAPLPFTAHLIFCVLATLLYAVLFNRRGKKHYLILMIAIDLTLMTQFWTQEIVIFFIGFSEVVMLIMALGLSYRSNKEERERERSLRVQEDREKYEQEHEDYKPANENKDDNNFIDNAFEDDDF